MRTLRDILSALRQNKDSFLRLLTDDLMAHTVLYAERCGYDDTDLLETKKAVLLKLNGGLVNTENRGYICLEHLLNNFPALQRILASCRITKPL